MCTHEYIIAKYRVLLPVTSYPPVDGNLLEKGNFENSDCTTVSGDDSPASYLFKEDTQNLEEENDQEVEILTDDNGGENSTEKNATSSKKVTKTETDGCNADIIEDTAVDPKSLPSQPESENEVTNVVDWDDVVSEINQHMERLGWDTEKGQRYLIETYGVRSRLKLSDRQLLEFLGYLKSQPTFKVGQTVLFQGVRVVIERFVNDIVAVIRSWDNPKEKSFEAAIAHLKVS